LGNPNIKDSERKEITYQIEDLFEQFMEMREKEVGSGETRDLYRLPQSQYLQAPSLIRIIIPSTKINNSLELVMKRIHDTIGGNPTVLDDGIESTIIQSVDAPILEELPEFKPFVHLWPSNLFLKFAAEYLSDGLDTTTPTFESCMLPVPGTFNSKNMEEVKVIHKEDHHKPSIIPLFEPFLKYLKDLTSRW
jgi:hypothetical protein